MTFIKSVLSYLLSVFAAVVATMGLSSPSHAFVNQVVIDSVNTANFNPVPLGSSTPSTTAVGYTIYTGRIFGLLDPSNQLNSGITDIGLASWSGFPSAAPNGMAQYVSQFTIVTPTNPAQRSGLLIYEVSNRGGNAISTTALVQGATYVQSGWQGDLLSQCSGVNSPAAALYPCINISNPTAGYGGGGGAYGTTSASFPYFSAPAGLTSYVLQVPVATTDGNPAPGYTGNVSNNTITGSVYSHIKATPPLAANTFTAQLVVYSSPFTPYQPANISDTTTPQFYSVTSQSIGGAETGKTTLTSSQWSWAYCPNGPSGAGYTPNPTWICINNGAPFNVNNLYEMVYTAANPLVQGVGFASTRDIVSFLRYGTSAPGGGTNPLAGTITKSMIVGVSQSGAYARSLVFYGFNQDESNRIVFDGAWVIISGRILWMMPRWSQPNVLQNLDMGGGEGPTWWGDWPNQARNLPANGILHRCNATTPNTCPQVLDTWGGNEFYISKMGVNSTGYCTTCTSEIPNPPNVYRYYVAGATHGGGAVTFNWVNPSSLAVPFSATQMYPTSPIPENFTNNALQSDFVQFLMNGTPMPPSVSGLTFPSFAQGQLIPSTSVSWPAIPGVPYAGNQALPPIIYNFGPGENYANQSGVPTIEPPTIQQVLTAYVPTVNTDGNENVGSIPTVLNQAPLGTYMSWNVIPNGPYVGQDVLLNAGYYPFWDTKANRTAHSDPRPSLEERYGTHLGYNCVVQQAASQAVQQRFLLPSDQQTLVTLAANGNVLTTGFAPTTADVANAHNKLCGLTTTHDFNGAYRSSVLWRDVSGNVGMWLMNGSAISSTAVLGNVAAVWSVTGQRDFNGDGNTDVLWRDTSGNVGIWLMNGTTVQSSTVLGNVPNNWSIVGTGDFNGDGLADILWRDTSGNVGMWLMNGTSILTSAVVGNVSTNWVVAGADAHGDIFWRNSTTGEVGMWVMNGTKIANTVDFGPVAPTWTIVATGDFDGNGSEDILWRDTSGNVGMWLMNGTSILSTSVVGNMPLTTSIAETGDINGDGTSDILWTDSSGNVTAWFMNGATISSTAAYGNVGTSWSVQALNAN